MLGQTVQKRPPNLKGAWAMHAVKKAWSQPTLLKFNDWLRNKAEAHERMKVTPVKPKSDEFRVAATKTKTTSKVFASISKTVVLVAGRSALSMRLVECTACTEARLLWHFLDFGVKTPTQRAKVVADNRLCFSFLNGQHTSDSAKNHASAPQKVVQALTALCYTELRDFSDLYPHVDPARRQKHRTY